MSETPETNALDRVVALAAIPELAELHPDDLASLAARAQEHRIAGGDPCDAEPEGTACFLLEGCVERSGRRIEAPALVGGVEALAGAALALRAAPEGAHLLRVAGADLRRVTVDVFEVWLSMLRHTAARLWAVEPLVAEPQPVRRLVPADVSPLIARILLLHGSDLLRSLRVHTLGCIAAEMEEQVLPAGETLWQAGSASSHVCVLLEGSLVDPAAPDHPSPDPGSLLGLREALAGAPRASTLAAAGETRLLRLACDALVDELEDDPDMAEALLEALARRTLQAESAREERSR